MFRHKNWTPDKMKVWNHSRPQPANKRLIVLSCFCRPIPSRYMGRRPAESAREGAFDGKRAVDGAAIHTAARDSGFLEKVSEKVKFSVAIWERI